MTDDEMMDKAMDKATDDMGFTVSRDMYEKAIGKLVIEYIHNFRPYEISPIMESSALRLIFKIRDILDDDDLGDRECFHRIDEMVRAFDEEGIYTHRHDW